MNVMITGAAGFIGRYLARECAEAGCSVFGIDIRDPEHSWPGMAFERCDIRDLAALASCTSAFRPHRIFHLAAQSSPMESLSRARETIDINVGGTVNLFECLRASGHRSTVVVACSSAEYGVVPDEELPVRESHSLNPLHPYGVSKVAQDLLSAYYFASYSMPVVRVRIFETTGPGKLGDVCSDLTRRAIEIETGIRGPSMPVGNLETRRTITDVRDMVRALWLAAEHGEPGEVYNVGGEEAYSAADVIGHIRPLVSFRFAIEQRPELMRHCDEPVIAGDNAKFRARCDWLPTIRLQNTLQGMLDWWRAQLAGPGNARFQQPGVPPPPADGFVNR
jgi:GDP-4-dehydro-6-deoxy-D-mannose reductase